MAYRALAVDTGGTVLDWHGSIVDALASVVPWQTIALDRHGFANEWRRRTMKIIVGQVRPAFHMDDVHLRALDETIGHFKLPVLEDAQRTALWRTWHRLRAWPDGTTLAIAGSDAVGDGRRWKRVRDPDGRLGWVPADFVVPIAVP